MVLYSYLFNNKEYINSYFCFHSEEISNGSWLQKDFYIHKTKEIDMATWKIKLGSILHKFGAGVAENEKLIERTKCINFQQISDRSYKIST